MTTDLPDDLLRFLQAGRTLEFDSENSEVGQITLVKADKLSPSTITTFPNCQSIIDDPYGDLEGLYQIEVYDLIAESDHYDTEGLFCWITALRSFASVDSEHGDVLTFPNVTWTEIVNDPQTYLDAQWDADGIGTRALPWLHFPFKLSNSNIVLFPYDKNCPIHSEQVTIKPLRRQPLSILQKILMGQEWLPNYLAHFPFSGLPISEDELLCCVACFEAEKWWIANLESRGICDQS